MNLFLDILAKFGLPVAASIVMGIFYISNYKIHFRVGSRSSKRYAWYYYGFR